MKPQSFIDKYLGQTVGYPDGQYVGECLSIVKLFIKEVYGINPPPSGSNSAYGYWSNFPSPLGTVFEKISNDPGVVPKPFDVVIWKPTSSNSYGHIAIVKSADPASLKFISWDQNWNSKSFQETSHLYTNVIGWLRAKEVITSDNTQRIADLEKEVLEKNKQISGYEEQVTGLVKKIDEITAQLKEANASSDGFRKQHNEFVASLASKLGTRQETVEILASVDTCLEFEDKAGQLDRTLELERKEHEYAVNALEKKIATLESNLEALKADFKALKDTQTTPIQPTPKYSIIDIIKKMLGI